MDYKLCKSTERKDQLGCRELRRRDLCRKYSLSWVCRGLAGGERQLWVTHESSSNIWLEAETFTYFSLINFFRIDVSNSQSVTMLRRWFISAAVSKSSIESDWWLWEDRRLAGFKEITQTVKAPTAGRKSAHSLSWRSSQIGFTEGERRKGRSRKTKL